MKRTNRHYIISGNTMSYYDHDEHRSVRCEEEYFGSENPQNYVHDLASLKLWFVEQGWMQDGDTITVE